jgi:hypothetical protein
MIIIEIISQPLTRARATIVVCLYRDDCVVIRHDQPQPAVEAMRLSSEGCHLPASVTSPTTIRVTAGSQCPPSSHRIHVALAPHNRRREPRVNRFSRSPRDPYSPTRILKSP